MECKGPGAKNCTVCPAGLLLHMDDSRCLRCCNASHPHRSQDCCDCQSTTGEGWQDTAYRKWHVLRKLMGATGEEYGYFRR